MLAGWITFSAWAGADGVTVVQIQALERTNDPLYELGYVFGGNRLNSRFWIQTAENLARHFGVADPQVDSQVICVDRRRQWRKARHFGVEPAVESQVVCVDKRRQWHKAGNVWKNAAVRTFFWTLATPVRWLRGR